MSYTLNEISPDEFWKYQRERTHHSIASEANEQKRTYKTVEGVVKNDLNNEGDFEIETGSSLEMTICSWRAFFKDNSLELKSLVYQGARLVVILDYHEFPDFFNLYCAILNVTSQRAIKVEDV